MDFPIRMKGLKGKGKCRVVGNIFIPVLGGFTLYFNKADIATLIDAARIKS